MEDRRKNTSHYRFVQYNVEWLFTDYYSSASCPGTGCPWKNTTEAETHLDYVAKVIQDLQPDTIHLCEVEGCDELNELVVELGEVYNPYLIQGTDTSTGQNVGMLTKIDPQVSLYRSEERVQYPIPQSTCGYTGTPSTTGVSKHYITEFIINTINIAVIGTHLLAYPTDVLRCAEREAQAQVIQNIIFNYTKKNYEIIVSGDLNDFDGTTLDANNNKPISSVLNILKGNAGVYKNTYELQTVGAKMVQSMRYSDWYDKNGNCQSTSTEFSQIDHILVTPNLYASIQSVFMYHEYEEYCGTYNSDHYPLVVDFVL
jgi:exonuclease III